MTVANRVQPSQTARRRSVLFVAAAAGLASAGPGAAYAQTYTPIGLTGWNQDIIAETTAQGSTSTTFDGAYVFYSNPVNGAAGGGLPASGSFASIAGANTPFQFQPYTAPNAVLYGPPAGTSNASTTTLTLGTPNVYSSLAFLVAGGNSGGTLAYSLTFADGSTQAGSMTVMDWFNTSSTAAITGVGRVRRATTLTGFSDYGAGQPKMFENDITVGSAKPLASINVTGFTPTNTGSTAALFAVSGIAVISQLSYTGATSGAFDTATANFAAGGAAVAFANGNAVTFDDSGNNTAVTVQAAGVLPFSVTFNNSGKNYSFAGGPIAGSATVALNGSGTVTFNNANTYAGPTNVSNGTLVVGPTGSVASSGLNVNVGATLTVQAGGQLASGVAVAANGTVNLNNPTRVLGSLTGTGTVNVNNTALTVGSGTTFTGTFAGTGTNALNVAGGTIAFNNPASMAVFAGGVTAGSTASGAGTVVLNDGSGSLGLAANGVTPITLTANGGTVAGGGGGSTSVFAGNVVVGPAGLTLSTGVNSYVTLAKGITGTGPVTLVDALGSGSGITLNGPSTYVGDTSVLAPGGTTQTDLFKVALGADNGISPNGGLTINTARGTDSVDLSGHNQTVTFLAGSFQPATVLTNTGGTPSVLTVNGGYLTGTTTPASFNLPITGNLSLVKAGAGNQILGGANTFAGTTSINAGTLTVTAAGALSTGTVNLGGGTLNLGSGGGGNLTGFAGFVYNGGVQPAVNNVLQLTVGSNGEAKSAFAAIPANFNPNTNFTVSFTYQSVTNGNPGDGATFTIENDSRGSSAVGGAGGGLGYGTGDGGTAIGSSVAVEFNNYNNYVGFGTNGAINDTAASSLASYTYLNGTTTNVTLSYNAATSTLTEVFGTATHTYSVNLASILGGSSGYVGFTGGTGASSSAQNISNFTFNNGNLVGPLNITNPIVATANTASAITTTVSAGFNQLALPSLTLNAGSKVSLSAGNLGTGARLVSTIASLSVSGTPAAPTSQLDITNTSVVLPGRAVADVTALARAGYANGTYAGNGITSSTAPANARHTTTVGVIANTDPATGQQLYGSGTTLGLFGGANPAASDVLVKYTYFGDANLDGKVDGSDYTRIDAGYAAGGSALTGWYNGDFNYDGRVDGSDYTLIDNAFNLQGVPITGSTGGNTGPGGAPAIVAASTAEVAGAAVPEPASAGLLVAAAAAGLLARRRRA